MSHHNIPVLSAGFKAAVSSDKCLAIMGSCAIMPIFFLKKSDKSDFLKKSDCIYDVNKIHRPLSLK